ncbi:MAG: DUF5320 domain-containing protein [Pyrinomonadaceae bacterium]|nr:DUF5320 domain-containing protein [Pyrinomonadaceae bacterium]
MNTKRVFLYLLIASVAVSALLGIGVILLGQFGETESRILGTSLTITVMSLLGLACGANFESGRLKLVPIAGIGLAVISALIWIVIIWSNADGSEYVLKTVFTSTLLATAFSYSSLINFADLEKKFVWAQYAAYLAAAFLVGVLLYVIWINNEPNEEVMARIIGSNSVLLAALTVIVPIFHKLSGPPDEKAALENEIESTRERLNELEERLESFEGEQ